MGFAGSRMGERLEVVYRVHEMLNPTHGLVRRGSDI